MIRDNRGFSLVEVLVTAAILGGLALALTKLTDSQMRSTKTVETRFEYQSILNDIRETLGDKASCIATLGNRDANNTPVGVITEIRNIVNLSTVVKYRSNTNIQAAQPYGNGSVRIVSYRLSSTDVDPSMGFPNPTSVVGATNLIVRFYFGPADKVLSTNYLERRIRMNVKSISTADRRIAECTSTGGLADMEERYVNENEDDTMNGTLTMNGNLIINDGFYINMLSDRSLKKDIRPIDSAIDDLRDLRPVSYKWKKNNEQVYGFIAQDVAPIYPDMVNKLKNDKLSIDYIQMTPLLVRGVQEVDEENARLKIEIKELREMVLEMKKDLCTKNPKSNSCQ